MPTAFTLRLRPFRPWRPDASQLHGLACALFERSGTAHDRHDKPFATWPVARDPADPHVGLLLRCSWLRDEPSPFDAAATPTVRLGSATCALVEAHQRQAACADLATGPPATTATGTFRSPTYFAHNGEHLVNPEPRLIV